MKILVSDNGYWNTKEGWAKDSFDYSQEGGYSIEEQLAQMEEYDPEIHVLFGDGHVELKPTSLDELYDMMLMDDDQVVDADENWVSDLPTFGGEEPKTTTKIWSWDEMRVIYGTCHDDLDIINREEL